MKRSWAGLALAGLMAVGLADKAEPADDKAGPKDNIAPKGFTALFNGKDLTNWQAAVPLPDRKKLDKDKFAEKQKALNAKVLPHWKVQDGVLTYDGKGGSLGTVKDYGDFELLLDWKIEDKGDSGLYLRGNPQVQIWDSDKSPGAKGEDKGSGSGGLWNNTKLGKRPLKKADKPVGQWNTFHITMKGDKVTVVLNGVKVVDAAPLENFWEKGKPLPAAGPVELQHHGDRLWFKNIYVKELAAE